MYILFSRSLRSVQVTEDIIQAGTKLKVIGRAGAGLDNIDTAAATARGIIVMNTPGGNTSAAAELTLSLLMSMARQIPQACAALKNGAWERTKFANGRELRGKTIGIIGLGMIGTEVARRCQALDMKIIGFDPQVSTEKAIENGITKVNTLDEIYSAADFISLHTPMNSHTKNLINSTSLAKCKKGVFIINAARGGIVNEADILAALKSGQVAGAAIDVYETEPPSSPVTAELIAHPNVVCTPHLGAYTEEAQKKVARDIAQQMCDAFARKGLVGVANAAHVSLAFKPFMEPYVRLAEALGSLQGQTIAGAAQLLLPPALKHTTIRIDLEGSDIAVPGAGDLISAAALKGLLPALPALDLDPESINLINAGHLAKQAGLKLVIKTNPTSTGTFSNMIRIAVTGPTGEKVATGAVLEGQPRVVQVDHWQGFPSFAPEGHLLMYNNIDAPGEVARVTSVLADNHINIASLKVARQFGGGGSPALSVLVCDNRIPTDVAARLASLEGISNVRTASFGNAFVNNSSGGGTTIAVADNA